MTELVVATAGLPFFLHAKQGVSCPVGNISKRWFVEDAIVVQAFTFL